jgi:hypothetical protein
MRNYSKIQKSQLTDMIKTDGDCLVYLVDGMLSIPYLPSSKGNAWDCISCHVNCVVRCMESWFYVHRPSFSLRWSQGIAMVNRQEMGILSDRAAGAFSQKWTAWPEIDYLMRPMETCAIIFHRFPFNPNIHFYP